MGNQSTKKTPISPENQMKSFEQLKSDVDSANELGKQILSSNINLPPLNFQLLVANKASRALLPLIWKFHKNVIIKVTSNPLRSDKPSYFEPKAFYTLFSILKELQKASATSVFDSSATAVTTNNCSDSTKTNIRQPSYDDAECALCMDAPVDVVTPCAHAFCQQCLSDWKSQNLSNLPTCPICRGELVRANSKEHGDEWVLEDPTDSSTNVESMVKSMQERVLALLSLHQVSTGEGGGREKAGDELQSTK
jgi:hypothetical protein